MKTKYTIDGNCRCPFCKFKNYFIGTSLKKCKHLHTAFFDKKSLKHKWQFDGKAKGFKPVFTVINTTPRELVNVAPLSRMTKINII